MARPFLSLYDVWVWKKEEEDRKRENRNFLTKQNFLRKKVLQELEQYKLKVLTTKVPREVF